MRKVDNSVTKDGFITYNLTVTNNYKEERNIIVKDELPKELALFLITLLTVFVLSKSFVTRTTIVNILFAGSITLPF